MKNLSWGLLSLLSVITLAFSGPVAKAATEHHGHHHVAAQAEHQVHAAGEAQVKDTCCEDCDCCEGGECTCEDCGCCKDGTCSDGSCCKDCCKDGCDCCSGGECNCDDCGCCENGTCDDGCCGGGCEDGCCGGGGDGKRAAN